jgi:hypothetical protein
LWAQTSEGIWRYDLARPTPRERAALRPGSAAARGDGMAYAVAAGPARLDQAVRLSRGGRPFLDFVGLDWSVTSVGPIAFSGDDRWLAWCCGAAVTVADLRAVEEEVGRFERALREE